MKTLILTVQTLAFGELERTACFLAPRLLSLNHSRIPGEEGSLAKGQLILLIETGESPGKSHHYGTDLTGGSTALNVGPDIEVALGLNGTQRLKDAVLIRRQTEVIRVLLPLMFIFPLPSRMRTRATAVLRRPTPQV